MIEISELPLFNLVLVIFFFIYVLLSCESGETYLKKKSVSHVVDVHLHYNLRRKQSIAVSSQFGECLAT